LKSVILVDTSTTIDQFHSFLSEHSLPMATAKAAKAEETKKDSKATTEAKTEAEGKKAGPDAPPVTIGWDSHQAVVG
jgi:CO dehydrogenase/acetyl-CoA synthase beta subunit